MRQVSAVKEGEPANSQRLFPGGVASGSRGIASCPWPGLGWRGAGVQGQVRPEGAMCGADRHRLALTSPVAPTPSGAGVRDPARLQSGCHDAVSRVHVAQGGGQTAQHVPAGGKHPEAPPSGLSEALAPAAPGRVGRGLPRSGQRVWRGRQGAGSVCGPGCLAGRLCGCCAPQRDSTWPSLHPASLLPSHRTDSGAPHVQACCSRQAPQGRRPGS